MTVMYIDGASGHPRFDNAIIAARKDSSIVNLVFVSARFCLQAAQDVVDLLHQTDRVWKSVMISNCAGSGIDTVIAAAVQTVQEVELRGAKGVTPEHAMAVQYGLQQTKTLQKLCLSITSLDEICCQLITEGLRENTSVTSLHFSCTKIFPPVTSAFVTLLASCSDRIQSLRLDSCRLEDAQLQQILTALEDFHQLRHLSFPYNRCQVMGYQALAKLLQSSTCRIQELDCSRQHVNTTNTEQFNAIFESIPSSLTKLNLSYCELNDQQMNMLIRFLVNKQSLRELFLCGCKLSEEAAMSLASVLPQLRTLQTLWLTGSQSFTKSGIDQLVHQGLRHNVSLYEFLLPQWLVSAALTKTIAQYVDLNRAGRRLLTAQQRQKDELETATAAAVLVPAGLWPVVLARIQQTTKFSQQDESRPLLAQSNATYYMLREKILLETSSSS